MVNQDYLVSDQDEYVSVEDAAALLGVSRPSAAMLADAGRLGTVQRTDAGHRRVARTAVLEFLAESIRAREAGGDYHEAAWKAGLYDLDC